MADTIRTGIVGATVTQGGSGWGTNAHVPALHLLPDYTLQVVCTAHEDTAQAYRRAAHAFASGMGFEVDFDLAVTRHTLIDAIERSAAEERVVTL